MPTITVPILPPTFVTTVLPHCSPFYRYVDWSRFRTGTPHVDSIHSFDLYGILYHCCCPHSTVHSDTTTVHACWSLHSRWFYSIPQLFTSTLTHYNLVWLPFCYARYVCCYITTTWPGLIHYSTRCGTVYTVTVYRTITQWHYGVWVPIRLTDVCVTIYHLGDSFWNSIYGVTTIHPRLKFFCRSREDFTTVSFDVRAVGHSLHSVHSGVPCRTCHFHSCRCSFIPLIVPRYITGVEFPLPTCHCCSLPLFVTTTIYRWPTTCSYVTTTILKYQYTNYIRRYFLRWLRSILRAHFCWVLQIFWFLVPRRAVYQFPAAFRF